MATPMLALAAQGHIELRPRSFHDCTSADLAWADVLVLQRPTSRRAWQLQQRMQAGGGQVVVEMDDLLTHLDPALDHAQALVRGLPWLRRCLAAADAVSVSTARLGQALAADVKRCHVVPNSALLLFDSLPLPRPQAPVTLLLAASDHLHGGPLWAATKAVLAQCGAQVQVVAVGRAGDALAVAGINAQRWPALPRAEFVARVRALPNAVAVIPLDATPFNACKSAIKFFDYGAAGLPVLCSDVSPYREVIEDGRTGALVANTEAAWTAALLQAIQSPAWRQSIAAAAQQQVALHHGLDGTLAAWAMLLHNLPLRSSPVAKSGRWATATESLLSGLRAANRRRLARRKTQADQPDKPS